MKKITKTILSVMMILSMVLPVAVSAENIPTGNAEYVTESTSQNSTSSAESVASSSADDDQYVDGLVDKSATVDDLGNKVMEKLNDVVDLLRSIAAPLSVITFIGGAIFMVFGAFGKKDGVKTGILICVLSAIMYAMCSYASPIITSIVQ